MPRVASCLTSLWCPKAQEDGIDVSARTFGAAIDAYAAAFGMTIRPYDGSIPELPLEPGKPGEFWWVRSKAGDDYLIGVAIWRGNDYLEPKQDRGFLLHQGDKVDLSPIAG
jgi:hypothetical protein